MLSALLRHATAAAHAQAEQRMPSLEQLCSREGYAHALKSLHGFFRVWEPAVFSVPSLSDVVPQMAERTKRANLDADIAALGLWPFEQVPAPAPPMDYPAAIGAMYVLEGSTLGGRVIERHVAPALGLGVESGCRFFHGYGERTGAMWTSFTESIDRWAVQANRNDDVVAGSLSCFNALSAWLVQVADTDSSASRGMNPMQVQQ